MYYLRSCAAADAIKFTLDVEALLKNAGDIKVEHALKNSSVNNSNKKNESDHKENSDEVLKKVNTGETPNKLPSKLPKTFKLVPKEEYEEEQCLNCGS